MKETIDRIRKFRSDRDWAQFHTPDNLAKAISIEAGELLEHFLWDSNFNEVIKESGKSCDYVIAKKEEQLDLLISKLYEK